MRSITLKLAIAFLFVGLTGAVLVAFFVRQRTRTAFDTFLFRREQEALIATLIQYYGTNGSWEGVAGLIPARGDDLGPGAGSEHGPGLNYTVFTLIGPDQTIVFSARPEKINMPASSRELKEALPLVYEGKTIGWLASAPYARQPSRPTPEQSFLTSVNQAIVISALVAAGLALLLGGVLAFTMTRSLRELTEATIDIARGKFGRQVKIRSKDELGQLAHSFNQMSLDLERATQARRQMTADIAHDLRSPLSVLSGYAEALNDEKLAGNAEIYKILYQETRHLSRLVDDLRTLSLADAGELQLTRTRVNPAGLIEQIATRHGMAAQQKQIALRVSNGNDLPELFVDEERITQVFDNLVLNAFRYTPAGGEVLLAARALPGRVEFQVQDSGAGIAADDLPYVFDRFYKGDKSRHQNGESGLGLAIAKSIIELHKGTISAASTPGSGTVFTISLPAASNVKVKD